MFDPMLGRVGQRGDQVSGHGQVLGKGVVCGQRDVGSRREERGCDQA